MKLKRNGYLLLIAIIIPHYVIWVENLKRWTEDAGLDPTGITTKSSRKTWESGLHRPILSNWNISFCHRGMQ